MKKPDMIIGIDVDTNLADLFEFVSKEYNDISFRDGHVYINGSKKSDDLNVLTTLWFSLFCMTIPEVNKELANYFFKQFDFIRKEIFKDED